MFEDLGCNPSFFITALKEPWQYLGTNATYLKRKKNKTIIGYEFAKKIRNLNLR